MDREMFWALGGGREQYPQRPPVFIPVPRPPTPNSVLDIDQIENE